MAQDLIRYDLLAQDALRGVLRRVLADVAKNGLPGEHHFFIAFDTRAPGVRISPRLHEKYPEEMTVVLQHQFWDFVVTDQHFEVGLSFGNVPERLVVPFDAVKGFFDPSVQFGLQFEVVREGGETTAASSGQDNTADAPPPAARPAPRGAGSEPKLVPPDEADGPGPGAGTGEDKSAAERSGDGETGKGQVVSLDAFRKKP